MNAEAHEKIGSRHEMRCLELKDSFNIEYIETAGAFSLRGGRVFPCGEGCPPLRRWASSPVRRFWFPCTRVWVSLYGQTRRPARNMHSPYTVVPLSLHGGFNFPTRRFEVPYTEQEGIWRTCGIIDMEEMT